MAGTTVDIGTGTTIVFGTSNFSSELTGLGWSGIARESVDTSHMGTSAAAAAQIGQRTFLPGDLVDPGEISIELHFDPDQQPPIDQAIEVITITFPLAASTDVVRANWSGSGFMTDFELGVPLEDKMTATATLKMTSNITLTAATST